MEILSINKKENTAIIKKGINIHKTPITKEIQQIIDKNTKTQENKENTTKPTKTENTNKQKNTKKQQKQDKNTKKQQEK